MLSSDGTPQETTSLQGDILQPGATETVAGPSATEPAPVSERLAEVVPEATAVAPPESSFETQPAGAQPEAVSSAPLDTEPKFEINAESESEAKDSSTPLVTEREEIESPAKGAVHESALAPAEVLEEALKLEEK